MLSGKDVQSMLDASKRLKSAEQTLNPRDTFDEWLVTFGITAQSQPAEAENSMASTRDLFATTSAADCRIFSAIDFAKPERSNYCINGEVIRSDHAYSVVTTDHLADDKQVYTTIAALPGHYKDDTKAYLTEDIANFIVAESNHGKTAISTSGGTSSLPKVNAAFLVGQSRNGVHGTSDERKTFETVEKEHQERRILQVDVAKVVVAYNARLPQGGDANVENKFQGATDARASSPQSFELDLEAKVRTSRKVRQNDTFSFALGSQSELTFDRSVLGNLSDNPVNGSYPLNNFTAGPFVQLGFKLPGEKKNRQTRGIFDGKKMIVVAPFQYQRQIVGSFLFFPFTPPSKAELTVHSPSVHGFSHRIGFRGEGTQWKFWDPGTYAELGWQVAVQNNLLSSLTLSTPGVGSLPPCFANSTLTINNCVKNAHFLINGKTTAAQALETLHAKGLYWDVHWQKGIVPLADKSGPGITLMFDSTGDWFASKPDALSSQTLYDIPLKLTLAFPLFRNFSIGPAYSPFFYSNQINHKSLIVESFALNARWYFDRDAAVRFPRQVFFKGPASTDETKTAKIK